MIQSIREYLRQLFGINFQQALSTNYVVCQTAIPFILSGGTGGTGTQFTMGNNGAISNLAPMNGGTVYNFGAFIYMPAGAIQAGSAAGWYWFVASSATAGTVFNNRYTTGDPNAAAPVIPTPFVSTGPGNVSQTIGTDIIAQSVTILGGSLGRNGRIRIRHDTRSNANANGAVHAVNYGGAGTGGVDTGAVIQGTSFEMYNRNNEALNWSISSQFGAVQGAGGGANYTNINTAQNQAANSVMRLQTGNDGGLIVCESFSVEVIYGA